jgi:GTP-binding protein HflX
LDQIGASEIPQIEVYNKVDLVEGAGPRVERGDDGLVRRVWISAKDDVGIDLLLNAIAEFFHREYVRHRVRLGPEDGRLRSRIYQVAKVLSEEVLELGGWEMEIELPRHEYERLISRERELESRLI